MRNLQIIGNVPQVRRESNFGEYAEEAVIIEEQPQVKERESSFLGSQYVRGNNATFKRRLYYTRIRQR